MPASTYGGVGDLVGLLVLGNVEVDPDEDLFSLERDVGDGELAGEGHFGRSGVWYKLKEREDAERQGYERDCEVYISGVSGHRRDIIPPTHTRPLVRAFPVEIRRIADRG